MTRLIKRYANRKLYDVTERRYITLDEVGELIQANHEVQVIDKSSGADITEQVLAKIAAAAVQQPADGALPKNVLVNFIQRPSDALMDYVRKTINAGVETVHQFDRMAKNLRGMLRPDEESDALDVPPAVQSVIDQLVRDAIQARLAELGVPDRGELDRLRRQVATLERQLERLQPRSLTLTSRPSSSRKMKKSA